MREMSANQVVAYNLIRAREAFGMTQEMVGQELGRYLGEPWSKSTYSVAESAVDPTKRQRQFTPGELLAFSRIFGKDVAYFLTPPEDVRFVYCGQSANPADRDVRKLGVGEVRAAIGPASVDNRMQAARLRAIADELEIRGGKEDQ